jgi:flagellar biosynthesis protein FlhA
MLLAVDSGAAMDVIPGIAAKDPVFDLDALWIEPELREQAERLGYTVIEPSAVISTHLSELVKQHAPELLSRQDVNMLVDEAKKHNEAAVTELVPNVLGISEIQKVLQHLLREKVPIRDMVTILETMADFGTRTKDPEQLGELVRSAISRTITRQYVDHENKLCCITLDPPLERQLLEKVNVSSMGSVLAIENDLTTQIVSSLKMQYDNAIGQGYQPVLLSSTQLRLPLRRFLDRHLYQLPVLAYNEVSAKADVEFVGQVRVA